MYLKQCEVESRVEFFTSPIQDVIKAHSTIKKWAYILHDKDDEASPHYHIYLNFGTSGVNTEDVAKWFGLQESCVQRIKGRSTDMLLYLIHGNDSQQNKHQYNPSEVHANFDFGNEINNAKILGSFDDHSYAQQLEYIHSLPATEQSKEYRDLENRWKLHCRCLSLQTDRELDVVFICGKGGTGKTFYAKKMCDSLGYDFCVSSSSNDPFQDYCGQKAIILDDLRDKAFDRFEDLLKILDNNTMSSVQSRFANKVFNGKLIVITSSVPLVFWYKGKNSKGYPFNVEHEGLIQLYRRIGTYVVMTEDEVTVYNQISDEGKPTGLGQVFKNEVVNLKKKERKKTDFCAVFEKICESCSADEFDKLPTKPTQMNIKDI